MKKIQLSILLVLSCSTLFSQASLEYTTIPDYIFEAKLIQLGHDSGPLDGKVLTANIDKITSLNIKHLDTDPLPKIENLKGIEGFKALTILNCSYNSIQNLDLSQNTALITLDCFGMGGLRNLNLSGCTALKYLDCHSLGLRNLILPTSPDSALTELRCYDTTGFNILTSLELSHFKELTILHCYGNKLTDLNLSNNKKLTEIGCSYNLLKSLNLKNGNNYGLDISRSDFKQDSNTLTCIQVDDVAHSNANWAGLKDPTASYTTGCNSKINLPSNNFTIESKGESCTDANSGEINISATEVYPFAIKINTTDYTLNHTSLKVSNLAPGTYSISISIPGEIYSQNFTAIIPENTSITGKSSITNNKIDVEISQGTPPYTVFIDGIEQFKTTSANFAVDLKQGLLEVKTTKICEGIYAREIPASENLFLTYPNPTTGYFEIELPGSKKEVIIELYNSSTQLISQKTYTIKNGKAELNLENQPSGLYIAKIESDTPSYLKIIKK